MKGKILDFRLQPAEPLWQRVPSRDVDDRPLSDFMMLIPRLSRAPEIRREQIYGELRTLCRRHAQQLYFVDLNLRLNLLWISVDATPGVIPRLAAEIRERIPEAVLVGHECGLGAVPTNPIPWYASFKSRILQHVARRPGLCSPDNEIR